MRMREIDYGGAMPVAGYGPGFFRIGGEVFEGAVLLLPGAGPQAWGGDVAAITARAGEIDLLILGSGAQFAPPEAAFREALKAAGIALEVMPTPAACRSYNMLLAEGRRLAAVLLPV